MCVCCLALACLSFMTVTKSEEIAYKHFSLQGKMLFCLVVVHFYSHFAAIFLPISLLYSYIIILFCILCCVYVCLATHFHSKSEILIYNFVSLLLRCVCNVAGMGNMLLSIHYVSFRIIF